MHTSLEWLYSMILSYGLPGSGEYAYDNTAAWDDSFNLQPFMLMIGCYHMVHVYTNVQYKTLNSSH